MTRYCFLFFVLIYSFNCPAQDSVQAAPSLKGFHSSPTEKNSINKKKAWIAGGVTAGYIGGSLIALNKSWYSGYNRTSFHLFNDGEEWLQVDKAGHAWSTYNLAKNATAMWHWTGMKHNTAVWIGGLSSLAFMTTIEYMDGHSAKWGWSWSDMVANVAGIGLFSTQDMLWGEQRIQYKFSAHTAGYDPSLQERTNDLFGNRFSERLLKDYNHQTYWLSVNLHSFFKASNLPPWLNVAVGYGADGLLGGFANEWTDKAGSTVSRYDIERKRQFYFAPDIDFTKIKTNKKGVRTLLSVLNVFKMPAPALMLDSKGKLKAYAIYF